VSSNPAHTGVFDTTLCDKDCQWLVTCRWFSACTPVTSTNKTDRHDITEVLLKVVLNTITLILAQMSLGCWIYNLFIFNFKIAILQTFSYMQIPIMISTALYFLYLDNYNDELQSLYIYIYPVFFCKLKFQRRTFWYLDKHGDCTLNN
jgi:hypothetical protein